MDDYENKNKFEIPDEIFKEDDCLIINKNLAELIFYIKLFFIGIILDEKSGKNLGYHFFNELISIEYDAGYNNRFVKVESLCSYIIGELEILLMYNSKEEALNEFFSKYDSLKNIKEEIKVFVDIMYLINILMKKYKFI